VQSKLTPIKTSAVKRPPSTPTIPGITLNRVISNLSAIKRDLDTYAAHLRTLDRKRLNNIGTKREGFSQRAYRLAIDNPEFLPNYLSRDRYEEDYNYFEELQTAADLENQVRLLLNNINTECQDVFYTDGLDFYAAVREAYKRRVDAAEAVYKEIYETYFKKKKSPDKPETKKQQLRNAKGIINGTREGKFEAENIKPKASGGVHKVIDEQFKDSAHFKEDMEGEIDE
jgi:hypothetical protein